MKMKLYADLMIRLLLKGRYKILLNRPCRDGDTPGVQMNMRRAKRTTDADRRKKNAKVLF